MHDLTPESLFDDRVRNDPSAPLLTFYDDATGERAELSAKSLGNWVAKTHFLLMDELGCAPGDRAFVTLPVHWLVAPILFGCWSAGLEVVSDPSRASVMFGDVGSLATVDVSAADEVFAVSLLTMARSATPPAGMTDFAAAVRPQPDSWATVRAQASSSAPALDGSSRAELVDRAQQAAAALGLEHGSRLMWTAPHFSAEDWVGGLLAPLSCNGSVVLVRNGDPAQLQGRATEERVTVVR